MSIQVSAGQNSLIALGFGISDITTLWSLGRQIGNWWTAESGDKQLLQLLDADEHTLLHRQGVMNTRKFNLVWGRALSTLANGEAVSIEGPEASEALGELSSFTACMVVITTTLDIFATNSVVRLVMKDLLKRLLRNTESGENLMTAELSNRINAWRSAGQVRCLHSQIRKSRIALIKAHKILDGFLPRGEALELSQFLYWLLAERTDAFRTASSDIAGIAKCLSISGFDTLGVEAFEDPTPETPYRLILDQSAKSLPLRPNSGPGTTGLFALSERALSTVISLTQPEECIGSFPISRSQATRARGAWAHGSKAASAVMLRLKKPMYADMACGHDLRYEVVDLGTECGRVENLGVHALALAHGLVLNRELCDELGFVLEREAEETLTWLLSQTQKHALFVSQYSPSQDLKNPLDGLVAFDMTDDPAWIYRIEVFTVYQAFLMGYYYGVFLSLVDLSSLQLQVVDGAWGYRSAELLVTMREICSKANKEGIPREKMLELLSKLLFSSQTIINGSTREEWCVGVTGKRTLLCSSLLNACQTPSDIGKFVLLDVDVGSLPRNREGCIRPGLAGQLRRVANSEVPLSLSASQLASKKEPADCTRHIEADWEYDAERITLCIRFKGRRITALNVAEADMYFCLAFVSPVLDPISEPVGPMAISTIQDCLSGKIIEAKTNPVLVHTGGNPCMRYMFAALYAAVPVAVATNCLKSAKEQAEQVRTDNLCDTSVVIIY